MPCASLCVIEIELARNDRADVGLYDKVNEVGRHRMATSGNRSKRLGAENEAMRLDHPAAESAYPANDDHPETLFASFFWRDQVAARHRPGQRLPRARQVPGSCSGTPGMSAW